MELSNHKRHKNSHEKGSALKWEDGRGLCKVKNFLDQEGADLEHYRPGVTQIFLSGQEAGADEEKGNILFRSLLQWKVQRTVNKFHRDISSPCRAFHLHSTFTREHVHSAKKKTKHSDVSLMSNCTHSCLHKHLFVWICVRFRALVCLSRSHPQAQHCAYWIIHLAVT